MDAWLQFWENPGIAHHLLAISLVSAIGLAIGRIEIRKVGIGVAGVLFAGLIASHSGIHLDHRILEYTREFGLILFVFSIGLQMGPGFFASLRSTGLVYNLLAVLNIALSVIICITVFHLADLPIAVTAGLLSGAVTNTPSLAAAQQALIQVGVDQDGLASQAVAYALAYPFGVFGLILTMILARHFGPPHNPAEPAPQVASIESLTLSVSNPAVAGRRFQDCFGHLRGLVASRLRRAGKTLVPTGEELLEVGDLLHVAGPVASVEQAVLIAGGRAPLDLRAEEGPINNRRLIVTHKSAVGKSLPPLQLLERCGVVTTRISRQGLELSPSPDLRLQLGDVVTLVGTARGIEEAGGILGNSPKELDHTRVGPLFLGIFIGVALGMIPIALPEMPGVLKLGLAGGPLIVALILSRIGSDGPVVWYIPPNAALALKEIGIVLFLACISLRCGDEFFEYLLSGTGLPWMLLAAAITFIPAFTTALVARTVAKIPLPQTAGLLAGSMTGPPALAFAQTTLGATPVGVAYVTVYPLTMLLRVIAAQVVVFLLAT